MSVAMDSLLAILTQPEISELGQTRIDAAMQSAISAYSISVPRELIALTPVAPDLKLTLPLLWVEGFSYPKTTQYPVMAVTGTDNDVSISIPIDASQWILNAGSYELSVIHNLEFNDLIVECRNESDNRIVMQWDNATTNEIKIYSPLEPDYRFSGRVIIRRIV